MAFYFVGTVQVLYNLFIVKSVLKINQEIDDSHSESSKFGVIIVVVLAIGLSSML